MRQVKRMRVQWYEGAPALYYEQVAFLTRQEPDAYGNEYEVLFVETSGCEGDPRREAVGTIFGPRTRGEHFFLPLHEVPQYKEAGRRRRVAWKNVPPEVQRNILQYLTALDQ